MANDHAPLLFQYKGNQKKNIWVFHYTKLRQKPQNNQWKTKKLAIPYAQFYAKTATNLKNGILTTPIPYQLKGIAIMLLTINLKSFGLLKLSKTRQKIKIIF